MSPLSTPPERVTATYQDTLIEANSPNQPFAVDINAPTIATAVDTSLLHKTPAETSSLHRAPVQCLTYWPTLKLKSMADNSSISTALTNATVIRAV